MTEKTKHLLVVDDDRDIRQLLGEFLRKHGYRVSEAEDGRQVRQALTTGRFDLVVLDIMMPGEDGLSLCRWIRANLGLPIILLTALGEETDRIVGLEMGADDYLAKPFNPRELLARIRSVLRRTSHLAYATHADTPTCKRFDRWVLDPAKRELRDNKGVLVTLTSGEYELLLAFIEHPGRTLSRDQLLDITRGREATSFDRSIDVQLSRLRKKIEHNPKQPQLIKTVRNGGYVFSAQVTEQ